LNPAYANGAGLPFVEMGASGANYNVATRGDMYTAGLAYHPTDTRLL